MLVKVRQNSTTLAWGLLLLLGLVWGSSFILIKQGLTAFSAAEVGALRIASASVFLLPVALPALRRLSRRHLKLLAFIGLFGSLGPAFPVCFCPNAAQQFGHGHSERGYAAQCAAAGSRFFRSKHHAPGAGWTGGGPDRNGYSDAGR